MNHTMNVHAVDIQEETLPVDMPVVVVHKHGMDYIYFTAGMWWYCYSKKPVESIMLRNITHWIKVEPNKD